MSMTHMNFKSDTADEQGFTYIDVLIAMMILLVGVLALSAAVTLAVVRARDSELQLIAKQHAISTLESIFAARDTTALGWNSIGNKESATIPDGIFSIGRRQLTELPGTDGIYGTTDDAEATTADAVTGAVLSNFQREIVISKVPDPDRPNTDKVRSLDVTIFYRSGSGTWRSESVRTIITDSLAIDSE